MEGWWKHCKVVRRNTKKKCRYICDSKYIPKVRVTSSKRFFSTSGESSTSSNKTVFNGFDRKHRWYSASGSSRLEKHEGCLDHKNLVFPYLVSPYFSLYSRQLQKTKQGNLANLEIRRIYGQYFPFLLLLPRDMVDALYLMTVKVRLDGTLSTLILL